MRRNRRHKLEKLAACLVGRLLGISIVVAKSGFQHGAMLAPSASRAGAAIRDGPGDIWSNRVIVRSEFAVAYQSWKDQLGPPSPSHDGDRRLDLMVGQH